jgi:hypothetical protein
MHVIDSAWLCIFLYMIECRFEKTGGISHFHLACDSEISYPRLKWSFPRFSETTWCGSLDDSLANQVFRFGNLLINHPVGIWEWISLKWSLSPHEVSRDGSLANQMSWFLLCLQIVSWGKVRIVWRSDAIPQVGLDARHGLSAMCPGVKSVVWQSDAMPQIGLDARHALSAMYPGVKSVVWRSDAIPQIGLDAWHALSAMYPGVKSVVWRSDAIPQIGLDDRHALSAMYPGVKSVVWRTDAIPQVVLDARHALSAMYPGVKFVVWRSDAIPQVGLDARHALSAMYHGVKFVVWRSGGDAMPQVGLGGSSLAGLEPGFPHFSSR